jgi:hypothetical protein
VLQPTPSTRVRPTSTIVAKDTTPYVDSLVELPGGDVLVVETPGFAEPPGRLLRRDGTSWKVTGVLPGVNAHARLSPDRKHLVAAGPLFSGSEGSCVLIDLEAWRIVRTLPVMRPFVWIDDARFVAQSPRSNGESREVDPALAAAEPSFLAPEHALVVVDLVAGSVRPILPCERFSDEESAVLAADRVVITATRYMRITAVGVDDGRVRSQRPPVRNIVDGGTYAIAAAGPSRPEVIAVGIGEHDVLRLDPATGHELGKLALGRELRALGLPVHNAFECVATRADGLLVIGSDQGVLVERWPDGRWEAHKVAQRGIRALAFTRGGTQLVVGGAERNLRVVSYE